MGNRTPLYDEHVALGGRMVDFAGWELPVMYSSIVEEHHAVRNAAGIFDVSHMGEIEITGEGATVLLEKLLPTRLSKLQPGKSMYSCFCSEAGGIIDDLFVYMKGENEYFLVVNASTTEKDLAWIHQWNTFDAMVRDLSSAIAKIDLQGPKSKEILLSIIDDSKISQLPRFCFIEIHYEGEPLMISQSGYTGEFGFELYLPNSKAPSLWKKIIEAGKPFGLLPCGLGARDTLRLEAAYSLYGHELDETTTPVEAGIGWVISSEKEYVGKTVIEKQKHEGALRETVCFECVEKGIVREHCEVLYNGREIGITTSGTFSPTLKKSIGMARVASGVLGIGDEIGIVVRGKALKSKVVKRPFVPYRG